MPDKCPRCKARLARMEEHTQSIGVTYVFECGMIIRKHANGLNLVDEHEGCLRRQVAALREALRDLSSGIDGIGQALHYGDISSADQIVVVAQKHMQGMPRSWFFDAEVSDDE